METKQARKFQSLAAWLHPFPPGWKPRLTGMLESSRHAGAATFMARSVYLLQYQWVGLAE
jgi:hypothetical protein